MKRLAIIFGLVIILSFTCDELIEWCDQNPAECITSPIGGNR